MVLSLPCLESETNLLWAMDHPESLIIIGKLVGGNVGPSALSHG